MELTDAQVTRLVHNAEVGKIVRAWCLHPGFSIFKKALEEVVEDKKQAWLKGSDDEARVERIRAQGVEKALELLKQFMLVGDSASQILAREQADPLSK